MQFIAACLSHGSELVRFIAWHSIVLASDTSLLGRNISKCSVQYSFKVSDFIIADKGLCKLGGLLVLASISEC